MLKTIRADCLGRMVLGSGVLLAGTDPSGCADAGAMTALLESAAAGDAFLGVTTGSTTVRCVPETKTLTVAGIPGAAEGCVAVTGWDIRLTGALHSWNDTALRLLTGGAGVPAMAEEGETLCWAGDTPTGPVAVVLRNAVNHAGLSVTAKPDEPAALAFDFRARWEDGEALPCTVYLAEEA